MLPKYSLYDPLPQQLPVEPYAVSVDSGEKGEKSAAPPFHSAPLPAETDEVEEDIDEKIGGRLARIVLFFWLLFCFIPAEGETRFKHHEPEQSGPAKALHLQPCFPNASHNKNTTHWKCGYLDVPLDYTNSSDHRTARLAVVMYQAGKEKSNRTMVINPGGPGGSGTFYAWRMGETLSKNYTDHTMDVLGFDPRGVNMSNPHWSCYDHDAYRDRWATIVGQFRETTKVPEEHLRIQGSYYDAMWEACTNKFGDYGRFLSTAFVARDVDSIRAALGEEELTAYMVSYGTGIGSTYAQMFPDRVGRVLLDGCEFVMDHRRIDGFGTVALDNITDAFNDGFLGECARAGPGACALAEKKGLTTVDGLQSRIRSILDKLLQAPLAVAHHKMGPSLVRYEGIIDAVYGALYNSAAWPRLARMFSELEKGNGTLALEMIGWAYDPESRRPEGEFGNTRGWKGIEVPLTATDELTLAVICSDSYDDDRHDFAWWDELQANMTQKSWIGGNSRFFDVFPCFHFKTKPAEVYRGGFDHSLRNPLLLIGETYDPATPLQSAKRLKAAMGNDNARLVAHHGYGHSSRDRSECTERIKRDMFLHGKWPEDTVECYADTKPYPPEDEHKSEARFGPKEWKETIMMASRRMAV
ncbi:hypothetical protein OC842_000532 [Tilletia horrida]|uniref:AB hydrolase-1 domain-containing protein n=1 Tax=Tilletia horrida TaxID=155126 RepID=A0AAN6JNC6_9BASI|nr:hypothetical protein OC842_000532 [Tilletia horrida]